MGTIIPIKVEKEVRFNKNKYNTKVMKKSVCIIISLLSILCAGCIEKEEKIIKDSCKNIIQN